MEESPSNIPNLKRLETYFKQYCQLHITIRNQKSECVSGFKPMDNENQLNEVWIWILVF